MRSYRLVELVEQNISISTSKVYKALLVLVEPSLRTCKFLEKVIEDGDDDEGDDSTVPEFTTEDIAAAVPESLATDTTFGVINDDGIEEKELDHPKKHRKKGGGMMEEATVVSNTSDGEEEEGGNGADESDIESGDNISTMSDDLDEALGEGDYNAMENNLSALSASPHHNTIRSHLLVLAQHPSSFTMHIPRNSSSPEKWTINFRRLMNKTIRQSISETIGFRYGTMSVRLANILADRGKLDEKTLCSMCLIREKEMRNRLTTMQNAGLLELQEVPRDNARVASRTNFLFFFDQGRCKRRLLDECYKTMTRLLQRAALEKEKVKGTLEKANRSDVVGKEDELLSGPEREALQNWRTVEERLWGQVERVDDMVALLRDF